MKCFVAAVAAAAFAAAASALPAPDNAPAYSEPAPVPAAYSYEYAVKDDYSGNDFGHQETRNGDATSGSYYVQMPDGRLQKVTYTVDAYGGYQAEVTYEGTAQYPPAPAPYKAAPAAPAKSA